MALVDNLEKITLVRSVPHSIVNGTYSIVLDDNGEMLFQIDTYGSDQRQIQGKKSQSIRFTPKAIRQLSSIIENEMHPDE
jgi:hypothetical protein